MPAAIAASVACDLCVCASRAEMLVQRQPVSCSAHWAVCNAVRSVVNMEILTRKKQMLSFSIFTADCWSKMCPGMKIIR